MRDFRALRPLCLTLLMACYHTPEDSCEVWVTPATFSGVVAPGSRMTARYTLTAGASCEFDPTILVRENVVDGISSPGVVRDVLITVHVGRPLDFCVEYTVTANPGGVGRWLCEAPSHGTAVIKSIDGTTSRERPVKILDIRATVQSNGPTVLTRC